MRDYFCYFVYNGGQQIPSEIVADDLNEAFLKADAEFIEDEELDEILFWNDDEDKPFAVGSRVDEWHRYRDVGEYWNYIGD